MKHRNHRGYIRHGTGRVYPRKWNGLGGDGVRRGILCGHMNII
jgi:hypothetical protein